MRKSLVRFRVASYNTHKCRGIHGAISVDRVIRVIAELDMDVLCLQEVVDAPGGTGKFDQANQIAAAYPSLHIAFGKTRPLHGGQYGNMVLSRFPLLEAHTHELPKARREERGVQHCVIELAEGIRVNVFNVHFGTGYMERRKQVDALIGDEILAKPDLSGPRIVIGDFNEWTRGRTTKVLQRSFLSHRPRPPFRFERTYPGVLPLLSLDHCYYEEPLKLEHTTVWRSRKALVASDHLPLLADFSLEANAAVA